MCIYIYIIYIINYNQRDSDNKYLNKLHNIIKPSSGTLIVINKKCDEQEVTLFGLFMLTLN